MRRKPGSPIKCSPSRCPLQPLLAPADCIALQSVDAHVLLWGQACVRDGLRCNPWQRRFPDVRVRADPSDGAVCSIIPYRTLSGFGSLCFNQAVEHLRDWVVAVAPLGGVHWSNLSVGIARRQAMPARRWNCSLRKASRTLIRMRSNIINQNVEFNERQYKISGQIYFSIRKDRELIRIQGRTKYPRHCGLERIFSKISSATTIGFLSSYPIVSMAICKCPYTRKPSKGAPELAGCHPHCHESPRCRPAVPDLSSLPATGLNPHGGGFLIADGPFSSS